MKKKKNGLRNKFKLDNPESKIGNFESPTWAYAEWLESKFDLLTDEIKRMDSETVNEVKEVVVILAKFSGICFSPAGIDDVLGVIDKYKDNNIKLLLKSFFDATIKERQLAIERIGVKS